MEELEQAKQLFKKRKKAVTIIIGNQKGGVGKTTNTYLIAYTLANLGIKTLVCDSDPQSNSTKALILTKSQNSNEIMTIDKTLMWGVQQRDLKDLPVSIIENLDLLPSYIDFEDFAKYLYKNTSNEYEETHLLEPLFEPLKEDYDIILIDVPPLSVEVTSNAVMFSDYVLISLQTQDDSMTGAIEYIKTLVKLKMKYELGIEVLGALPMLSNSRGSVDKLIIESAKEEWGEDLVFETVIPQMERIKRFSINGITDEDRFDRKVLEMYEKVVSEMLSKLIEFEE